MLLAVNEDNGLQMCHFDRNFQANNPHTQIKRVGQKTFIHKNKFFVYREVSKSDKNPKNADISEDYND